MKKQERKQVFQKMLNNESLRRPELNRYKKLYNRTIFIWIVFSVVYAVVSSVLLIYTYNQGLLLASLMVPAAALFCVCFLNSGTRMITYITLFGGLFELLRGYLLFRSLSDDYRTAAMIYVILVIVQGIFTLGMSLFIMLSPKIITYLSAVKRVNREIDAGRY